eukprot:6035018-Amphidinium_carterae.8
MSWDGARGTSLHMCSRFVLFVKFYSANTEGVPPQETANWITWGGECKSEVFLFTFRNMP